MSSLVRQRSSSLPLQIADLAVQALVDEANLTPKPGLVDRRGSGAHHDLTLALMLRSAHALHDGFYQMCKVGEVYQAAGMAQPDLALRETIGRLGRAAEAAMMQATGGVNTHRGAIWALGLLSAAAALAPADWRAQQVAQRAAQIARLPDSFSVRAAGKGESANQRDHLSNGEKVCARYGVKGARGEAQDGFPHAVEVALPMLRASRAAGGSETVARLDALLAVMATLDDTCVLSRAGSAVLRETQTLAGAVLTGGGSGTLTGRRLLTRLDQTMLAHRASPGGAADILAAALLLDALEQTIHV